MDGQALKSDWYGLFLDPFRTPSVLAAASPTTTSLYTSTNSIQQSKQAFCTMHNPTPQSQLRVNPPAKGRKRQDIGGGMKVPEPLAARREKNRIAASKCRTRNMQRQKQLEDRARTLQTQHTQLLMTIRELNEELLLLKERIVKQSWECGGGGGGGGGGDEAKCDWGRMIVSEMVLEDKILKRSSFSHSEGTVNTGGEVGLNGGGDDISEPWTVASWTEECLVGIS
jgi:hypothetical protein